MEKTKKERLAAVRAELEKSVMGNGFVKNVGKVFFNKGATGYVLRDVVYHGSIRYGIEFELLSLDGWYFAGSKDHAEALKEAFGGRVYPSEFCHLYKNARELYIWEKDVKWQNVGDHYINPMPIEFEEAVEAIFS